MVVMQKEHTVFHDWRYLIEHDAYLGRPDCTTERSERAACGGDGDDGIGGPGSVACSSFAQLTPLASFLLTPTKEPGPLIYSEITTRYHHLLIICVLLPLTKNPSLIYISCCLRCLCASILSAPILKAYYDSVLL